MIAVHQVVAGAAPGDAVTHFALEIRDVLRQRIPSEVFAQYLDPRMDGEVRPLQLFDRWVGDRREEPLIIYHSSIGSPDLFAFMRERPEPVILIYQNMTPSHYFLPYDPSFAGVLAEGRRELAALRPRITAAFALSKFSAQDLTELGYDEPAILPFIANFERLEASDGRSDRESQGPSLLFVGQILPHKRVDLLLQVHHILSTYLMPGVTTHIVGASRLPAYRALLDRYMKELSLSGVIFEGAVDDLRLGSLYRSSDAFISLSEHEGFCVPIVEAMRLDLPVVIREGGAMAETLGSGGWTLNADTDLVVVAECLAEVLSKQGLREALVAQGRERSEAFDPDSNRVAVIQALTSVI